MQIIFEYHDVKGSERLEAFAKAQLEKLENKYNFITRADVFFKKENTSSDDTGMIANIRLSVPGPRLFTEASNKTFEASIKEAVNELESQLRRKKEKMKAH